MAKSKYGPALFELIKSTPAESAPIRREPGAPPAEGIPYAPTDRVPDEPPRESSSPEVPEKTEAPTHPETAFEPESGYEVIGGRVRFSLTQRTATITALGAVLVLIGVGYTAYRIGEARGLDQGRRLNQEGKLGEIEQARQAIPTRNLFEGIGDDPTAAAPSGTTERPAPTPAPAVGESYAAPSTPWVSGNTYIVVQDFKGDARGDAIRAHDFLKEYGVPAVILDLQSGPYRYRLITSTGFNRDDPGQKKQADDYLEKVRRIGQVYSENGGRYDFKSAYFKKLTGDNW